MSKKHVVNISKEAHDIISQYCQSRGLAIGPWAEEILMDEMRRILSKKGKRKEPVHAQA
jgi:hypothetical protein